MLLKISPTRRIKRRKVEESLSFFIFCHLGSILPNFFAKRKVAGELHLAKNLKFNFINKVVRLKLSQNLPNYICHLPNAVRQKRCWIMCAQKICAQMLMKSTVGCSSSLSIAFLGIELFCLNSLVVVVVVVVVDVLTFFSCGSWHLYSNPEIEH